MVKWIKASKGSRHISVVSSVEGMALKVGSGERVDGVDLLDGGIVFGCERLKVWKAPEAWRKLQTSTNSEL